MGWTGYLGKHVEKLCLSKGLQSVNKRFPNSPLATETKQSSCNIDPHYSLTIVAACGLTSWHSGGKGNMMSDNSTFV